MQYVVSSLRYLDALRHNLKEKASRRGVALPALCSCGDSLWETNPDTCANNCFFYRNHRGRLQLMYISRGFYWLKFDKNPSVSNLLMLHFSSGQQVSFQLKLPTYCVGFGAGHCFIFCLVILLMSQTNSVIVDLVDF